MNKEIERKYHLLYFPQDEINADQLRVIAVKQIDQTYLALSDNEEIRIRKIVDQESSETSYTHTFKKGNGLQREEVEYVISSEIYDQLLKMSQAVPLRKTRTIVTDGHTNMEIDLYEQFSLKVVEVEFSSREEALAYRPPVWFGAEIEPGEEKSNKKLWKDLQ